MSSLFDKVQALKPGTVFRVVAVGSDGSGSDGEGGVPWLRLTEGVVDLLVVQNSVKEYPEIPHSWKLPEFDNNSIKILYTPKEV